MAIFMNLKITAMLPTVDGHDLTRTLVSEKQGWINITNFTWKINRQKTNDADRARQHPATRTQQPTSTKSQ